MQCAIIVFPGSNRERDASRAMERASGKKPTYVWHGEGSLPKCDLIIVPGGFSFGDYLRTGAMAAHSPVMRDVKAAAAKGVRVLGICNGFQILCETEMLPGILLRNASLKFVSKAVTLKVETSASDFTNAYKKDQQINVIVAHGDGNYFAEPDTLRALEDEDRIPFRYIDNPNGSLRDIAGVFNREKNVLGLMPHPENAIEPFHGSTDGRGLFKSLVQSL